ncbi:MAG: hypothetical protein Edafosvirus28_1 [Edafosvirus sp.]|uniref:Uncharacterized protein n=1 Tax=Edafosvirus sp. TaxID=2487765 RepID=A0A3G4ZUZ6_9VIRU|nr:MAG: hypothetical protein Edafosvirus28_1 [Edafosvirus sp.]
MSYPNNINQSNKLLNGFQNTQSNINNKNNNMLFKNNPLMNYNQNDSSQQLKKLHMMKMYHQMDKIKKLQKIKQMEKINELDKIYDNDKIKESVMPSRKIEKGLGDDEEINKEYIEIKSKYIPDKNKNTELKKLWQSRNNQPYKNIIQRDNTKEIKTEEDLIVYKVADKDKIRDDKEYDEMHKNIKKYNNELKIIYSSSKEAEYKKKFEYNKVYTERLKSDSADFNDMKQDDIEYYKNEQKKIEKNKVKVDEILDSLVSNGILNEEEIKNMTENHSDEINIDKIENKLKEELGEEFDIIKSEAEKEIENEEKSKNSIYDNIRSKYKRK